MKKRGFTLVELLVVIAIIGILAAIGITAVSSARVQARDAKRLGDIRQIMAALEMFFQDVGRYPSNLADRNIAGLCLTRENNISSICTGNLYLVIPSDPLLNSTDGACSATQTRYQYSTEDSNRTYLLEFCLARGAGGYAAGARNATPAGIR
ncbi:MAG: prepilin-type N-terminal cleavage/methylation domain-containing protein [Patescibacteria group bacterium]|nr:prepilin-type N-terminal cleavage/methylation domain-containing protein [Patescibacteria group bacterium]